MREILFRGKQYETSKWLYGDFEHFHLPNRTVVYISSWGKFNKEVDPETVGQFTGLTDKDGTKIFEGDVVRVERDLWSGENKKEREIFNGVVWYDEKTTGFGLKSKKYRCLPLHRFSGDNQTVIGNIHDNPELLEKGGT